MTGFRLAGSLALRIVMLGIAGLSASVVPAAAQETVSITVPPGISFPISDVSRNTDGAPNLTTVSFSNANVTFGRVLRISVQAGGSGFTPPSGPSIPASSVSWINLGVVRGRGYGGTLSSSFYTLVFQSDPTEASGQIDLGWALAAPGSGIRAGLHQLTIRWKVESIMP